MKIFRTASIAAAMMLGAMGLQAVDIAPSRFSPREGKAGLRHESAAPAKVMKRLTGGGSNIYGYVGYDKPFGGDEVGTKVGALCSFGANGYTVKWNDPMWSEERSLMRTGYLFYDEESDSYRLKGTVPVYYTGIEEIITVVYYTYDFETGKFIEAEYPPVEKPFFLNAAYNEEDGYVYGLASYSKDNDNKPFFGRARLDNLQNVREISALTTNLAFVSICWNCDDGQIYGILADGTMMRVDKQGQTVKVADFGKKVSPYQTGLAYSPVEKLFYWNVNFEDGRSALYTIDINRGEANKGTFTWLYDFDNEEEFHYFVTTDRPASPKAPAAAEILGIDFPDGAVTGSVSFRLPSKCADGSDIPSDVSMRYQIMLDGSEYSGGNGRPGEEVTADFIDLSEEMHNFTFTSSIGGLQSVPTARETFIGHDTPKAPENVELTDERVAWEAVTEGVHSGYLNLAALEYEVYLDGKLVGKTKDYQLDVTLPADEEIHKVVATVIAVADGKKSEPGESNYIVAGKPLSLPVFFAPTANDAACATAYDGNADGNGWEYSEKDQAWVCFYSQSGPGDDWLFLAPIEIKDASKYYMLSFDSKIVNSRYPKESMEVTIGKKASADDQKQVLKSTFTPGEEYAKYESLLKVEEAGTYYVAFHYNSEEMQNGIYLRSVGISDEGLEPSTPRPVENLKAEPMPEGELKAKLSFTMPTKNIGGGDIDASKLMTVKATGTAVAEKSAKAGETVEMEVATAQGMNIIPVSVSLDGNTGLEANVEVYTGLDIPAKVRNLRTYPSSDLMGVKMTWESAVEGQNGGYVIPEDVTYDVYLWENTMLGPTWSKVGSAGKGFEYTYTFPADAPQELYQFGIRPCNKAGNAKSVTMCAEVAGTPYLTPMVEDFALYEDDFSILPWMMLYPSDDYTASWNVTPVSDFDSSEDGYLLVAGGPRGSKARITLPRFSSKGKKQLNVYFTLFGGDETTGMDLLASSYDKPEPVKIGEVAANTTEGFYKAVVEIPAEFLDKDWVALYFDASFSEGKSIMAVRRMAVSDTDGVDELLAGEDVQVIGSRGELIVLGAEGTSFDIYSADGTRVAHIAKAAEAERIGLPAGLYIAAGRKVLVK